MPRRRRRRLDPDQPRLSRTASLLRHNACHGGRQGRGLTYLSGWAPRLLELGAGAIVAPLWIVDDQQALAFARTFYEGLPDETLGEALRRARREVAAAGDPAAFAYSVFAHPQARVRVGAAV